jgi:diguanylate cyclase (GGDEF)-like protein
MEDKYTQELLKLTILYVDDEHTYRESIKNLLEDRVKEIYISDNGESGLKSYKEYKPDIVITDIKMPFVDGISMVKAIKSINPNTKIVYVNEYTESDILLHTIESGVDYFITKPMSKKSLDNALAKIVNNIIFDKKSVENSMQSKYILDSLSNMSALVTKDSILDCNRSLLDFCDYLTLDKLKDNIKSIDELFIKRDDYIYSSVDKDWIDRCFDNSIEHKVLMYNKNLKENRVYKIDIAPYIIQDTTPKYVISFTDITSLEVDNSKGRDPISDIYDRKFISNQLENYIEYYKDTKKHFSIIVFKVTNLAEHNLKHGDASGDEVLSTVMDIIKSILNTHFSIGRLSGAKFLILAPLVDTDRALYISKNIKTKLSTIENIEYSINCCEYDKKESSYELLQRAISKL